MPRRRTSPLQRVRRAAFRSLQQWARDALKQAFKQAFKSKGR